MYSFWHETGPTQWPCAFAPIKPSGATGLSTHPCISTSLRVKAFTYKIRLSDSHGPLARCVKLRVAHAQGMPGTFSLPPWISDPDIHHGTCVTHVPWCMPGSLSSCFLCDQWRGKRSWHLRRMRNTLFYVSGNRPMSLLEDLDLTASDVPGCHGNHLLRPSPW